MNVKKNMIFAVVMLCLTTIIGHVEARELIFTQGYNGIEVINADTDEIVNFIPVNGFVHEIAWTEDKQTMYLTTNRHSIVKIDLQQLKVIKTFDADRDGWRRNIWGFVLSSDNKSAYINSIDRKVEGGDVQVRQTISQIDLEDGRVLRSMTPPWGVAGLVYQKDGKALFAVGLDIYKISLAQNDMKIVDTYPMFASKKNILPIWHSTQENGGIFMSNYYTPEYMGLLTINAHTGTIKDLPIKGAPVMAYSFIYSADKTKAYGIMEDLTVIDLKSARVIRSIPNAEGTSYSVLPSGDGRKLYVGAGGSTITVYDAETLNVLKVLQIQSDAVALNKISF